MNENFHRKSQNPVLAPTKNWGLFQVITIGTYSPWYNHPFKKVVSKNITVKGFNFLL